jgi:hypothetical protein
MYVWQLNKNNTQKFFAGRTVVLNKDWSAYAYLKQEFGDLFPRRVESVDGDIVHLKVGKASVGFAAQCLSNV